MSGGIRLLLSLHSAMVGGSKKNFLFFINFFPAWIDFDATDGTDCLIIRPRLSWDSGFLKYWSFSFPFEFLFCSLFDRFFFIGIDYDFYLFLLSVWRCRLKDMQLLLRNPGRFSEIDDMDLGRLMSTLLFLGCSVLSAFTTSLGSIFYWTETK